MHNFGFRDIAFLQAYLASWLDNAYVHGGTV